jgi:hypothetical protein
MLLVALLAQRFGRTFDLLVERQCDLVMHDKALSDVVNTQASCRLCTSGATLRLLFR